MPASIRKLPWPTDPRFLIGSDGSIIGPSGRPLTLFVAKRTGYLRFTRYAAGRWSQHFVHVAVCETFHGPRPPGKWAAHGNDSSESSYALAARLPVTSSTVRAIRRRETWQDVTQ